MKKKKLFWSISLVTITAISAFVYLKQQGGQAVETTVVKKGEIKQFVEDTAVVQNSKKQTAYIEGSGKITSIKVNVGDNVKKGDILLLLDTGDLELKLKDANEKLEASKAQLQGTDLSNSINKIEIAQAAIDQSKVTYDTAVRNLNNEKILYASGSISKDELNTAEDAYKTAEAALKSANLQLEEIKEGTPNYIKSQYVAQVKQAVILKDSIAREIEKQKVVAQIDGVVLEKLVDENSMVVSGTAAFVIGDIKSIELEANILSDDINKVKIGNEVEVSGKPLDDSIIKGMVTKIAPEAKNITSNLGVNQKRVLVTIEIKDDKNLLKPGYDLDARIVTKTKKDTLVIPDTAVFDYKGKTCVFVINSGKTVLRDVKKGIEGEKTTEITEGLKIDEKILVNPDNSIVEGMKVKSK